MIVLLHGFTGAVASWSGVTSRLPGDAICEPLVGHAPHLLAATASFVDEIDRLAERLPPAAHVCGYSLGARLALGLAVRHPARCARVTLVGVNPGLADPAERSARIAADERWAELLDRDGIERFAAAWEDQPMLARDAETRAIRRDHDPHGLAHALRVLGLGRMPDWTPHVADLRVPMTVVVGELDHAFRAHAARFAHTPVVIVAGARHDVPREAPAALAAVLEDR